MLHRPDYSRWEQLLNITLPKWVRVQRLLPSPEQLDVTAAVRRELYNPDIRQYLQPGLKVAIGVGSRGIASLSALVTTTVAAIKEAGCHPFIVPAMGSHGGATAVGQLKLLAEYGITEEAVGASIRSSLEVVEIGRLRNGVPVYFDKLALSADLLIPINRIKPHTSFRGPIESGVIKMLVIGFGKHTGATALHKEGYTSFSQRLLEALDIVRGKTPFRFGLGVVEDSHNQIALVKAIPAEVLPERETELLKLARQLMPRLQFNYLDVLVVGCVGKDISGMGMDPNITGRFTTNIEGELKANKIVVLDLTFGTCGNAVGLGMADVTTERVLHKLDLDATWINALTSTLLQSVRIPVFMLNDRQAIQLAVKTCNCADSAQVRIAWIHNTRDLETIYVSEALWSDIAIQSEFIQSGELEAVPFDSMGNLKWNMVDS